MAIVFPEEQEQTSRPQG